MRIHGVTLMLGLLGACSEFDLNGQPGNDAVEPDILVDPMMLNFGIIEMGSITHETLTITNQGNATLEIVAFILEGEAFTLQANTPPFELPPGESLPTSITYTATQGADSGSLTIVSSDPDTPEVLVPLEGGDRGHALEITPSAHLFEGPMIDCSSQTPLTLPNVDPHPLPLGEATTRADCTLLEGLSAA